MGLRLQRVQETPNLGRDELARGKQRVYAERLANMVRQYTSQQSRLDRRACIAGGDPQHAMSGERRLQPDVRIRTGQSGLLNGERS